MSKPNPLRFPGRLLCLLAALLLCLCLGQAAMADEPNIDLANWMAAFPDYVPLGQLNIPGSYESCYIKFGYGDYGQTKNITEQLNAGVRIFQVYISYQFFPWPYAPISELEHLRIKPGSRDTTPFTDLMKEIDAFLQTHKSETVIVYFGTAGRSPLTNKDLVLSVFDEEFKYNRNHTGDKYPRFDYFTEGADIPTLGKARGKCLLIHEDFFNYYESSLASGSLDLSIMLFNAFIHPEYTRDQNYNRNDKFTKQRFSTFHPGDINIRFAKMNFHPGYGQETEEAKRTAYENFDKINTTIGSTTGRRIGWIATHFANEKFTETIIRSNKTK